MEEIRSLKVKIRELIVVVQELEEKIIKTCDHEFEREINEGMRDNGEIYYRCRKCKFLSF
tara:strand:+ start:115 stop:294 length:180 start_codon:yes stop_codon:yes gene_type:complete